MKNDHSNGDSKRQMAGKVAALIGLKHSIGFVVFLECMSHTIPFLNYYTYFFLGKY